MKTPPREPLFSSKRYQGNSRNSFSFKSHSCINNFHNFLDRKSIKKADPSLLVYQIQVDIRYPNPFPISSFETLASRSSYITQQELETKLTRRPIKQRSTITHPVTNRNARKNVTLVKNLSFGAVSGTFGAARSCSELPPAVNPGRGQGSGDGWGHSAVVVEGENRRAGAAATAASLPLLLQRDRHWPGGPLEQQRRERRGNGAVTAVAGDREGTLTSDGDRRSRGVESVRYRGGVTRQHSDGTDSVPATEIEGGKCRFGKRDRTLE